MNCQEAAIKEGRRVFIGGLPVKLEESSSPPHPATLREYFARFGAIRGIKIGKNKKTGDPLGFAFLDFKESSVALKVCRQKHIIHGREVRFLPYQVGRPKLQK